MNWFAASTSAANVRRLRRVKVLLAGRDRTYLSLIRLLLSRRDFLVTSTSAPSKLLKAAELDQPDVVLLDGTGALADAARLACAVEAREPRVRVVVVVEEDQPKLRYLRVLPKWCPLDRLVDEIERAYARDPQPPLAS
jgi:PleD family two-component response regulator